MFRDMCSVLLSGWPTANGERFRAGGEIQPICQEYDAEHGSAKIAERAARLAEHESILAKLKATLIFAGHDVEAIFDEAVALAKKL